MGLWGLQLLLTPQVQPVMQPIPVLKSPRYYKTVQTKVVLLSRQRECSSRDLAPYLADGACYLPFSDIPGVHLGPNWALAMVSSQGLLDPSTSTTLSACPLQRPSLSSSRPLCLGQPASHRLPVWAQLFWGQRLVQLRLDSLFSISEMGLWITDMGFE